MKKSGKRATFIAAGTAVLTAAVVAGVSIYANASMKVESFKAENGDLAQVIELNGNIQSEKVNSFYAGANGKVANVHVKVGDSVKKGDLLVSFDEERINYLISLAEYEAQAGEGQYENSLELARRSQALYNEAVHNLGILNQQITDTEAALLAKENELMKKQGELAGNGSSLQQALIEKSGDPDKAEEVKKLQKQIQENAYLQTASGEVTALQEDINRLTMELANFKEYKQVMLTQKAAAESGRLTEGGKKQLEALKNSGALMSQETIRALNEAKSGIVAEYDGIVTAIGVEDGAEVVVGMNLITLASSDDMIVRCSVNKYDIMSLEEGQTATFRIKNNDYTGKVTRIEKVIDGNGTAPGVGVEIKLDNPDDELILGFETKARVSVASVEGVLLIPREACVEENDKTYVYVLKDKKANRKLVETGVKNDDMIEVVSGLEEGEVVVWNDEVEIKDGMDVRSAQ